VKATSQDLAAIDRLIKPDPPERIYGWLQSQLSIARHYGGMTYQGARYLIDYKAEGQPLVRVDVIAREEKEAKQAKSKTWHDAKMAVEAAQGDLI
jgi:hypothetical protein